MKERILMAVDDSPASKQEIEYVAKMLDWNSPQFYLHLVHVLPPASERAEEDGNGKEDEEEAHALLIDLRERLTGTGFAKDRIDIGVLVLREDLSLADGLLDVARDQECGTIVVGRNSLAWYRELIHRHPADELVRKAHGFAVWVVE